MPEDAGVNGNGRENFKLKGFGLELELTVKKVVDTLKPLALWGAVIYALYTFHVDHAHIAQVMSEMTYVVSLPPDARGHLKLDMPNSLREKLR